MAIWGKTTDMAKLSRRTDLDYSSVIDWVESALRSGRPVPNEHVAALLDELDRRADEITELGNRVVALASCTAGQVEALRGMSARLLEQRGKIRLRREGDRAEGLEEAASMCRIEADRIEKGE